MRCVLACYDLTFENPSRRVGAAHTDRSWWRSFLTSQTRARGHLTGLVAADRFDLKFLGIILTHQWQLLIIYYPPGV